jgi:hypothetical protein
MNYLKLFTAASGLFPQKVKVTLIDVTTGNDLGKYKISAELLPVAFNRPVTLEINNIKWRVLNAEPVLADDFLFTKKLRLKVQNAAETDIKQLQFSHPSICNEQPATGTAGPYTDFMLSVSGADWRQIEFLAAVQLEGVEEASKKIETILNGQPNALLGYDQQYIREKALLPNLALPWIEFCTLIKDPILGNIFFDNGGFVENGFAVQSEGYTYYGILENDVIRVLCLTQFDCVDDELMRILSAYGLLLADWCNASILSAELGKEPKSEFINI